MDFAPRAACQRTLALRGARLRLAARLCITVPMAKLLIRASSIVDAMTVRVVIRAARCPSVNPAVDACDTPRRERTPDPGVGSVKRQRHAFLVRPLKRQRGS